MTPDYDIEIDQGTDTERIFNCVDGYGNAMDFSGYTARMQIRRSTYKTTPLDELTTENGRLFFDGARYDIEIISSTGRVLRLLRGYFDVIQEVTR